MAKFLACKTAKKQKRGAGEGCALLLLGSHEAKHQVLAVLRERGRVNTARTSASRILYSLLKGLTKVAWKTVHVAAWAMVSRVQHRAEERWTENGWGINI